MNRLTLPLFVLILVLIGGGAAWYLVDSRNQALGTADTEVPELPVPSEGVAIYTNGPYGFSVFYPQEAEVSYEFDATYHLGTMWRANALPESEGAPIVAIIPYAVKSENSYPRYFNAMVRIGASSDPKEIARCEKGASDQGETALPDVTINGTIWKAFSFQDAGMMQYASGISYRTMHEGKCIAVEKVRTGSNYKDDPASPKDIPEETLTAEYDKLSTIIESITFAR